MWRTRAVLSWLVEDIGGLPSDEQADPLAQLGRARRRARGFVLLDLGAIVALLSSRLPLGPLLPWGPGVDTVLTLGILAIAVHAGLRWGQLEKLSAVERLVAELLDRSAERDAP